MHSSWWVLGAAKDSQVEGDGPLEATVRSGGNGARKRQCEHQPGKSGVGGAVVLEPTFHSLPLHTGLRGHVSWGAGGDSAWLGWCPLLCS